MKTILLWDPRFPDRKPARLTVDDAIASAAVRSGCATAANPAEAGILGAGEPLDPTMLTEVVMQQANGTLRRVTTRSVRWVGRAATSQQFRDDRRTIHPAADRPGLRRSCRSTAIMARVARASS